jgi:hypothetical protein
MSACSIGTIGGIIDIEQIRAWWALPYVQLKTSDKPSEQKWAKMYRVYSRWHKDTKCRVPRITQEQLQNLVMKYHVHKPLGTVQHERMVLPRLMNERSPSLKCYHDHTNRMIN